MANKRSTKIICKQTVRDKEVNIKQPIQVLWLGSVWEESIPNESMTVKVINNTDGKLKCRYTKVDF